MRAASVVSPPNTSVEMPSSSDTNKENAVELAFAALPPTPVNAASAAVSESQSVPLVKPVAVKNKAAPRGGLRAPKAVLGDASSALKSAR